jgi:hypothetical protein
VCAVQVCLEAPVLPEALFHPPFTRGHLCYSSLLLTCCPRARKAQPPKHLPADRGQVFSHSLLYVSLHRKAMHLDSLTPVLYRRKFSQAAFLVASSILNLGSKVHNFIVFFFPLEI